MELLDVVEEAEASLRQKNRSERARRSAGANGNLEMALVTTASSAADYACVTGVADVVAMPLCRLCALTEQGTEMEKQLIEALNKFPKHDTTSSWLFLQECLTKRDFSHVLTSMTYNEFELHRDCHAPFMGSAVDVEAIRVNLLKSLVHHATVSSQHMTRLVTVQTDSEKELQTILFNQQTSQVYLKTCDLILKTLMQLK